MTECAWCDTPFEPARASHRVCDDCVATHRSKTHAPRPEIIPLDGHDCDRAHRTYAAWARCRWPRAYTVQGEGRFGVYVEEDHHYPSRDGRPGKAAVWPDIVLFETEAEALDYLASVSGVRKVYVFEAPADLATAPYEDRTITGIRARHAA